MRKITLLLIATLAMLASCKSKQKSSQETKVETRIEYKEREVFRDTGSIKTETLTEYVHFYDTITQKLYIYPKFKKESTSENKAITATKDKSGLVIQKIEENLTETIKQRNEAQNKGIRMLKWIFWLIGLLIISVLFNIWNIKNKFRLL